MSVLHPRLRSRWMSAIVTMTLLVAALLTLIHWHQGSPGSRCEICFARDLPSLHVPLTVALDAPTHIEWQTPVEETRSPGLQYSQPASSRAPPRISSL